MKKRILSAFLAVCIAAGIISFPVAAEEAVQIQDEQVEASSRVSGHTLSKDWKWRYYEYDDGTVAVCEYCRVSEDGKLVIPEMIDGKKVTRVGFIGEEFVVPDRRMIKNVTIPATVDYIDSDAFKHYSWMTDLTVLGDVSLEYGELDGCTALKTLTLGRDSINMSRFKNSPITTINFIEGLKHVTVRGSGNEQCGKNLTTINLPNSVKSFAAYGCPNLSSLNCAKHFSQIDISLRDCPKLHLEVWVKGKSMKDFSNTGITKITINVSSWGKYGWLKDSLQDCPYLKEIVLTGKNNYYFIKNGMLCWKKQKNSKEYDIIAYPAGKSTAGNFTLPKNVKCVYYGAFDRCRFKTITIPENITDDWYWDVSNSLLKGNGAVLCLVRDSAADTEDGKVKNLAKRLGVAPKRIRYKFGNTYRISYKLKGGRNAAGNPKTYRAGQIKKLKKPTRKGYKFLGWKRSGKTRGTYCNTTERAYGPFTNYTFTACWKKAGSADTGVGKKKPQKIMVNKSYKKTLGSKSFSLKAKSSTGAKLSYSSSNTKVVKVDAKGKVKIVGVGKAVITIAAKASKKYAAKKVKVRITVKK